MRRDKEWFINHRGQVIVQIIPGRQGVNQRDEIITHTSQSSPPASLFPIACDYCGISLMRRPRCNNNYAIMSLSGILLLDEDEEENERDRGMMDERLGFFWDQDSYEIAIHYSRTWNRDN
jgi:hypothetical protein